MCDFSLPKNTLEEVVLLMGTPSAWIWIPTKEQHITVYTDLVQNKQTILDVLLYWGDQNKNMAIDIKENFKHNIPPHFCKL